MSGNLIVGETAAVRVVRATADQPPVTLSSRGGLVTANHHLAARAGASILAVGGNAMDAVAATAFALGVVEPAMSGLGGRGYLMVLPPGGEPEAIDGHERAPAASRPDMFAVVEGGGVVPGWGPQTPVADNANSEGHRAVAVPGVVGALTLAHRRHGRLPLPAVMEPAIALATDGFAVDDTLANLLATHRAKLARFPATASVFLKDGRTLVAGEVLRQPDLARSLRLIADHGADEFYAGSLAAAIVAEIAAGGGILSMSDLERMRPRIWPAPMSGQYRDFRLVGVPDATGTVTLLQIMNMVERFDVAAKDAADPDYLHLLLEVFRAAFHDRFRYVDDGAFVAVPYRGLIDKEFARARAADIDLARRAKELPSVDPWSFQPAASLRPAAAEPALGAHSGDSHTTHMCAVDADRMVVSMTQSLIDAFGSGVVVPDTGILLNSAMHNFNPRPGQIGSIEPWKRAAHSGTPLVVLDQTGSPVLALGGAGGTRVVTGLAQVLVNVLDRGQAVQDAIAAPRVHSEDGASQIDDRYDADVASELLRRGHPIEVVRPRFAAPVFSRINGIAIDAEASKSGVDIFTDAGAAAPAAKQRS